MRNVLLILLVCLLAFTSGCSKRSIEPKIGVSLGVDKATRWEKEKTFMEERANELGVKIDVRLNAGDTNITQVKECKEMIDNGINVLIIRARDLTDANEIIDYAHKHKVKVIAYTGLIEGEKTDLFVGYDCFRIGQKMGQFLIEKVPAGDYIILSGDAKDKNVTEYMYEGAKTYLDPTKEKINIILDTNVPGWSPDEAKKLVREAIIKNENKVDAIFAANDKIAGACAEVIDELGITNQVVISGMDAELDAAKRIIAGKQSSTIYMYLKELAATAVDEAANLAKKKKVNVNAEFDNGKGEMVPAHLITGQLVTKENLNRVLIDSGFLNKEEVYGEQ
ncbi:MAG: sugar ABC transporter substrate-binding protein [Thermoguttaceae bacterium]